MGIETFLVIAAIAIVIWAFWLDHHMKKKRRASLRRDDTSNVWLWVGLDGKEKSSEKHPDEPGGAWHTGGLGGDGSDGGGGGE